MNELLKKLSESFGPSGLEDEVIGIIKQELISCTDICESTPLGSVYGIIKGKTSENSRLICANVDETSFMVSDIDDSGFIRVKQLSGYNPGALCGQRVVVGNEDNRFSGIMAAKVLHLASGGDRERPGLDKMFIDVGVGKKDDIKEKISIGDFVTYEGSPCEFGKNKLCGKALSSRASCYIALCTARKLKESGYIPENDVIFFFNTRSKVSSSDLSSAIYRFAPEKVILLSACDAVYDKDNLYPELGKGIILPIQDGSYLYFGSEMFKNAVNCGIAYQIPKASVDSDAVARDGYTNSGTKLLRVCLPVCNMNSSCEIISDDDMNCEMSLLEKFYLSEI